MQATKWVVTLDEKTSLKREQYEVPSNVSLTPLFQSSEFLAAETELRAAETCPKRRTQTPYAV